MTERQEKILGGLLAGAIGDSMGAVTEHTSRRILEQRYGFVTEIIEPHDWLRSRGHVKGLVTDDFSVAYYSAQPLLRAKQRFSRELAIEGLLKWNEDPKYCNCAGPTTKVAIARFRGLDVPEAKPETVKCNNSRVTNGGAMKSGIVGLFNPGNVDQAIDDTITLCGITHDNTLAMSGACAIAAATAQAFVPGCSYMDLIRAGIYGAEEGYKRSLGVLKPVAGASISKRIALAAEIGLRNQDNPRKAMAEIADVIGAGLYAFESVPAAFGYIAACKGNAMETIYLAVNAGDDTDTVACMVGFVVGAFCSVNALSPAHLKLINEVNGFDLGKTALEIDAWVEELKV